MALKQFCDKCDAPTPNGWRISVYAGGPFNPSDDDEARRDVVFCDACAEPIRRQVRGLGLSNRGSARGSI